MTLTRLLRGAAATAAAAALTLAGLGAAAPAQAAQPGQAGAPIVLGTQLTVIGGYDIATDPSSGTAYVGWISSNTTTEISRTVHLCVLPAGASACQGGILTTSAIEPSTANALHVVVAAPGTATLVWIHGEGTAKLSESTYAGGVLSASTDVGNAPANGSLDDVVMGPDGQIWAVTEDASSSVSNVITVRDGLGAVPTSFTAPFPVSAAQLAFNGTQPIVAVSHGSQITDPVRATSGPAWTPLAAVADTWQVGHDFDVVGTSSGARLISGENGNYSPVMSLWNGSTFTGAAPTGDTNNCSPSSHDLVTDGSGRIADVSNECSEITVANLADTRHAGIVRFSAGGTVAGGDPQIGTFANGTGWVAWAIQDTVGDILQVVPIRLPGQQTSVTATKAKNSVTLTGPASCLPAVAIGDSLAGHAKKGWKLGQLVLTLDGHKIANSGSIDGSGFASGSTHTLVGKGTFKAKPKKKHHHGHRSLDLRGSAQHAHHGHGHHHKTKKKVVTVTLAFRVC
jgi:hypothetical protein